MLLIEGCHSLVLIHGDSSYVNTASEAARLLVQRHVTSGVNFTENQRFEIARLCGV